MKRIFPQTAQVAGRRVFVVAETTYADMTIIYFVDEAGQPKKLNNQSPVCLPATWDELSRMTLCTPAEIKFRAECFYQGVEIVEA